MKDIRKSLSEKGLRARSRAKPKKHVLVHLLVHADLRNLSEKEGKEIGVYEYVYEYG